MATIISCSSISSSIRASSEPGSIRKPDPSLKKPVSSVSWWTPIFGISSEPDYVNNNSISTSSVNRESDLEKSEQRSRRWFTEEKAKQLRKKIAEASTFHEVMYHSAIASRLASDVSGRVKE